MKRVKKRWQLSITCPHCEVRLRINGFSAATAKEFETNFRKAHFDNCPKKEVA